MDKEQRRVAKMQLVAGMQEGYSWHEAAAKAGVQTSRSNAYRLWGAFRQHGETALEDGRHGHPIKLRGEARAYLEDTCRKAPQTPSSTMQMALRERFQVSASISQINRVRAALGASNGSQNQEPEKNGSKRRPWRQHRRMAGRRWQSPVAGRGSSNGSAHAASNSP